MEFRDIIENRRDLVHGARLERDTEASAGGQILHDQNERAGRFVELHRVDHRCFE
jgi:hypothetical protein